MLRPLCRVAAASGEMEGPGLGSQVSAAGRGQSWGGESGGGGRREREGVGARRLPGGASGEPRGLGWGGGSMETPRMMLGILSETTGKKRRGRTGGYPTRPPSSTVAQGAPWGRYPRAWRGPLRGLGRECGRSWERCQVTHLSWTSLS